MGRIKVELIASVFYLLIGCLWIFFSDKIFTFFASNQEQVFVFKAYNTLMFVFLSSVLLFFFLRRMRKRMKRSDYKSSEVERLKNAFVKNISHEIRTPINGISGFSQLLNDQTISVEDKVEYINIIERSSMDLLLAVNGIMDLSLLEAGGAYYQNIPFDVVHMLETVYSYYKNYEKKDVHLLLDCSIGSGLKIINSDQPKIKLVIGHLITNAFKYTTYGFIKIGCYYDNGSLVFYVKDTGEGVSKKNQRKLERIFSHTKNNKIEYNTGVGLGLTVSKSIIMHLGGRIWFSSAEEDGSTFFFSFPYKILKPKKSLFNIINN